jgi:hypothetical protein
LIEIVVAVVLIALNGIFAALADQGRPGALAALALSGDPGRFLSTVQIGIIDRAEAVFALRRPDGSWLLAGSMPADEMAEVLGITPSGEPRLRDCGGVCDLASDRKAPTSVSRASVGVTGRCSPSSRLAATISKSLYAVWVKAPRALGRDKLLVRFDEVTGSTEWRGGK